MALVKLNLRLQCVHLVLKLFLSDSRRDLGHGLRDGNLWSSSKTVASFMPGLGKGLDTRPDSVKGRVQQGTSRIQRSRPCGARPHSRVTNEKRRDDFFDLQRNNTANGRKELATVRCRRVRKKSKIGGEGTAGLSKRQPEVEWFEQGGGELTGERRTTQDAAPFFVESQSQSGLGPCEAHKCAGHTRV